MNHLFDRKTDAFFGSLRYLGYVLLPGGIILGGSPLWSGTDKVQMLSVGTLLVLLGLLFQGTYHGFQIDFQNKRVREYLSMFGLKTGKWAPLPAFKQVLLTSNLGHAHAHDHDHEHGHHHDEPAPLVTWYTIGLYSTSPEPDYELRTDSQQDALQTMELLAKRLHIPAENRATSPASHL
ncbi:hypothetical protein [Rufibacter psychrotolerans]|uniref:hypothetical protein n=1 Tax=Rufibacter psychrotolerans TaxID=2812556 RepID=UPI001968190C|nr:hypothetical protein [Rufibacter sp. SYSU D00308]